MSFRVAVAKRLILQYVIKIEERRHERNKLTISTDSRRSWTYKWVFNINVVQERLPFFADTSALRKCIVFHRQLLRCGDCATSALGLKTVNIDWFHGTWSNCLQAKTTTNVLLTANINHNPCQTRSYYDVKTIFISVVYITRLQSMFLWPLSPYHQHCGKSVHWLFMSFG